MVEITFNNTPRQIELGNSTNAALLAAGQAGSSATAAAASAATATAARDDAVATVNGKAPYVPVLKAATWANGVRRRFDPVLGAAAITAISGGNVTSPTIAMAYNDALFTRTGQPAVYRASGTATAAGVAPRFSIPISVADLALIGLTPSDSSPPVFSVRAAIQLSTLVNQTIDNSVSGTSFLNGYWQVALRYNDAGASLAGPNNASTDVVFIGTAVTPSSGIGIGNGDSVWSGSTGAQTVNSDEKILRRQNVPLRATYGGKALSGIILQFFGNAAAAGATSYDVGRVALIAGSTISETTTYLNRPEDDVFLVDRRNLAASVLAAIDGATSETSVAARITAMNGTNPAAWALGMDQAWDFTTGIRYGGASDPTDTHSAPIWVRTQAGYMASVSANTLARAEAVGLAVQPARTELVSTPRDWGAWYVTTTGTGTIAQNRTDPSGTKNKAYTLTDTDTGTTYARQRNQTVANDSSTYTASVYIRKTMTAPSCYPSVQVGYAGGTGISSRLTLDTLTGKVFVENPSNARWQVDDAGEFWKVSGSSTNNSTGNTTFFHVLTPARFATFPASGSGTASATGSHVFAWASIQQDSFAATDLPDGGSGGGNMVVSDQSAFSGAVAGLITLVINGPGGSGVRLFSLDDGTTNNYLALEWVSGNAVLRLLSGGAEQAAVVLDPWRTGRQTIAFCAGTNYVWGQFLRGDAVTPVTTATYPTINRLGFGGNSVSTATRRANVIIEKMALRYGVADANTAAEMLVRAAIAHGRVPEASDNFDRADTSPSANQLGNAPSGHAWLQLPANGGARVLAFISGKRMTANDSGQSTTAAYPAMQLRQPGKGLRARISFGSGTTGSGAALILTRNPPPNTSVVDYIVLLGAVHIVFTDTQISVGLYFDNGSGASDFFVLDTINYPTALARDGTIYEVGYDLNGNEITLYAPSMAPVKLTHPRILQFAGPYATFEPYWSSGQSPVRFHEVNAF